MTLTFPCEAIGAARKFGTNQLGLYQGISLDDLESRIMTFRASSDNRITYGTAQAIESGHRLRLFHQLDPSNMQFNCGEVGINAFTLYKAFAPHAGIRIIRYQPYPQSSSHFGLVRPIEGDRLVLTDPLMGFHGEIILADSGFTFFPNSWLQSHSPSEADVTTLPELAPQKNTGNEPFRANTEVAILDEDTVLRHVNHINSPLGFFSYFVDGQRLNEQVSETQVILYTCEVDETGLVLRGICYDERLLAFTLERTYPFSTNLAHTDKVVLHKYVSWVRPKMELYASQNGHDFIPDEINPHEQASELYHVAVIGAGSSALFTPHQRGWLYRRMKTTLNEWRKNGIKDETAAVFQLLDLTLISFPEDGLIKTLEDQVKFLGSQSRDTRRFMLDSQLNMMYFMRRAQEMPNEWPEQVVLGRLRAHAERLSGLFFQQVDAYFSSAPVTALLQQYKNALTFVEENKATFGQQKAQFASVV